MAIDSLRAPEAAPPAVRVQTRTRYPGLGRLARLHDSRWGPVAAVAALTIVSGVLRVGALHFHYWVDEGISVGIAGHPLAHLPALLREDGSPPLYYLLLHVWMALWGRGEVATHALSLIFALLTVPVAYWGAAGLFDRRTGIYCSVLAAGVPFLTAYAQETRMYSLLLALSLIVSASFVHVFVLRRRRYLPVFALSLAAALYTHNWALFLGVGAFVAFLVCVRVTAVDRRGLWRDGAIGFGAVALLYLPWLPTLLYQAKHTGAPWSLAPTLWSLTQGLYFLVGGRGAAVALLLAAGTGLLALRSNPSSASPSSASPSSASPSSASPSSTDLRPAQMAAVSLIVLGFGTLIVAWLDAKLTAAWAPRYLAVVVGPMILLVGLGLARSSRLGLAALALVCCFWVLDPLPSSLDSKSNVASAARVIRAQTGSDALVLSTQPEQVPTLAYYLPQVTHFGTPLGPVPDPRVVDWRNALSRLRRSSVRSVLAPMIAGLTPGERVALVIPTRIPDAPAWLKLIRRDSRTWTRYLEHDHQLRLLRVTSPHANSSGLPVQISLLVRR